MKGREIDREFQTKGTKKEELVREKKASKTIKIKVFDKKISTSERFQASNGSIFHIKKIHTQVSSYSIVIKEKSVTLKYTIRQTSAISSGNSIIFSLHLSNVQATSKHLVTFVMI